MPLYQNKSKQTLLLDCKPGSKSKSYYRCDPAGKLTRNGLADDLVDIAVGDEKLPGIAEMIRQKILVPFEGFTQKQVKDAVKPAEKKVEEKPAEKKAVAKPWSAGKSAPEKSAAEAVVTPKAAVKSGDKK